MNANDNEAAIARWALAASRLAVGQVRWGRQGGSAGAGRAHAPAIYLQYHDDYTYGGEYEVTTGPVMLQVNPLAVTGVSPSNDVLTVTNHGLRSGDGPVRLSTTGSYPGGLAALRDYWTIYVDDSHLKLASNFRRTGGGDAVNPVTPVDITSPGTGTLTLTGTPSTRRAGSEIEHIARGLERATVVLESYAEDGVGLEGCVELLRRVKRFGTLPSALDILRSANIGFIRFDRVHVMRGTRDAIMFEPRAMLEVQLCMSYVGSESGTIIQTTEQTASFPEVPTSRTSQSTTDVD